jgi:hypothetical protein
VVHGLLVVLLAGCAGVAAAPAPPAPTLPAVVTLGAPLAIAGESMIYEITFRGLRVARVQVAVGQAGWTDGHPSIIVKSHGETDGLIALLGELDWTLSTTMDLVRGVPLLVEEDAIVTFRGKTKTHHDRSTSPTHSIHSAVCALRGWRSLQTQQAEVEMRIDDTELDIKLQDAAREFLESAGKPAVRYDGVASEEFPFKMWISDDLARVPLRVETSTKWGAVTVELVEYNAPRD